MQQGFIKKLHNYFFRNYCNVQVSSTCEKHYKGSKLFFSYILLCLVVVYCNFIYAEFTRGNLYLKIIKLITFKYLTLSLKFHLHSEDKKKKKIQEKMRFRIYPNLNASKKEIVSPQYSRARYLNLNQNRIHKLLPSKGKITKRLRLCGWWSKVF